MESIASQAIICRSAAQGFDTFAQQYPSNLPLAKILREISDKLQYEARWFEMIAYCKVGEHYPDETTCYKLRKEALRLVC